MKQLNLFSPFLLCLTFCLSLSYSSNAMQCEDATEITPAPLFAQTLTNANLAGADFSGDAQCNGPGSNPDLWFKFTANAETMYIRVNASGDFDPAFEALDGCNGSQLACVNSQGAGSFELFWLEDLTIGNEYVYRVYHAGNEDPVTTNFTTAIAHVAYVKLVPLSCGTTNYTTNSVIKSSQPPTAWLLTNYQFKFVENEAPFNTYEVVSPNGTNPNFRLHWFDEIEYGRTYTVSVRVRQYEGATWGTYGDECVIGLQALVPPTKLQQQYANGTFDFCNVVGADAVNGASHYRWTFDDGEGIAGETYGDGDSRLLRLQSVPNLMLNQFYVVKVYATVNGLESATSAGRFLIMNSSVPNTGVNSSINPCGGTYQIYNVLWAYEVCTAESYTWRFKNTSQAQADIIYTRVGGNRSIRLNWMPALIPGDTYNVDVKADQGGYSGNYSTVCSIVLAEEEDEGVWSNESEDLEIMTQATEDDRGEIATELYPNPFNGGEVNVSISQAPFEAETAEVRVYNMQGVMIKSEIMQLNNGQVLQSIYLDESLPTGVYTVVVNSGNKVNTTKLIME